MTLREEIKELQRQIEALAKENVALRAKIEELDKRDYIINSSRNSFM